MKVFVAGATGEFGDRAVVLIPRLPATRAKSAVGAMGSCNPAVATAPGHCPLTRSLSTSTVTVRAGTVTSPVASAHLVPRTTASAPSASTGDRP